jgi:hypothetical protein
MGISAGLNTGGLYPGVCTSSTRPASPYEGQMIYETDTDMVALWNGSAWRYISATTPTNGTVLQVVSAESTTQTTTTSSTYATANLSASITPKSSTSKVFIMVSINLLASANSADCGLRLVRGSTTIYTNSGAGIFAANVGALVCLNYLDSPATTSSTTYTAHFARTAGTGTVYAQVSSIPSEITLMEIAA